MTLSKMQARAREEFDSFTSEVQAGNVVPSARVLLTKRNTLTRATVHDFLDSLIASTRENVLDEVAAGMPSAGAVCLCHQGGGYAVCCEECKGSLLCGQNRYREAVLSHLASLRK